MCAACDPKWQKPATQTEVLIANTVLIELNMILIRRATTKLIAANKRNSLRRLG